MHEAVRQNQIHREDRGRDLVDHSVVPRSFPLGERDEADGDHHGGQGCRAVHPQSIRIRGFFEHEGRRNNGNLRKDTQSQADPSGGRHHPRIIQPSFLVPAQVADKHELVDEQPNRVGHIPRMEKIVYLGERNQSEHHCGNDC